MGLADRMARGLASAAAGRGLCMGCSGSLAALLAVASAKVSATVATAAGAGALAAGAGAGSGSPLEDTEPLSGWGSAARDSPGNCCVMASSSRDSSVTIGVGGVRCTSTSSARGGIAGEAGVYASMGDCGVEPVSIGDLACCGEGSATPSSCRGSGRARSAMNKRAHTLKTAGPREQHTQELTSIGDEGW